MKIIVVIVLAIACQVSYAFGKERGKDDERYKQDLKRMEERSRINKAKCESEN